MKPQANSEVVDDRRYLALAQAPSGEGGAPILVQPREQALAIGRLEPTPFGMLAPSIAAQLGIVGQLFDGIVSELAPRCGACGTLAQPPAAVDALSLPKEGFLAAVLVDDRHDVALRERCELLGSERALVQSRIVRVEECEADDGEPVLALVSAESPEELRAAVRLWLGRGSAAVRVVHLAERHAPATQLALLRASWACAGCGKLFEPATKSAVLAAEECARCKGQGWLEVEGKRLTSCEECGGFGRSTAFSGYEWRGVELRCLSALPLAALRPGLSGGSAAAEALDVAISRGFGSYPLGAPTGTMSAGERARLSLACLELSRIEGLSLVADAASLFSGQAESGSHGVALIAPQTAAPQQRGSHAPPSAALSVRDIAAGPLEMAQLSVPCGAASLIQGESGSGKSLLLREVAAVFSKRKKLASRCSFPGLKSCTLIDPFRPAEELVGDLIEVMSLIAQELSGTRAARERGLTARDISLSTSPRRCAACADSDSADGCQACGGAELGSAVGGIVFNKMRWSEILHAPLSAVAQLLWRDSAIASAIESLPGDLSSRCTLATRSSTLTAAERRALVICAGLGRVLSARKGSGPAPLGHELVLIDTPFCLAKEHQELVWRMLGELNDRGATALCAGVPEALERHFASVVRLRPSSEAAPARMRSRMYDVRHSRAARVDVVKQ